MTYDDIDDIPWDELPEEFDARDKWICEHCSDGVKAQLDAEFEAEAMIFAQKYPGYPEYDFKMQKRYGAA